MGVLSPPFDPLRILRSARQPDPVRHTFRLSGSFGYACKSRRGVMREDWDHSPDGLDSPEPRAAAATCILYIAVILVMLFAGYYFIA
jgi:hypothetical protein